jgi:hypothetical protein
MAKIYEDYPFEDFARHYKELFDAYEAERRAFDPSKTRERPSLSFEENVIRISQYMRTRYESRAEAAEKSKLFGLIMDYLAENAERFNRSDYLVLGSDTSGALVSTHLLQAIHHIFTTTPLSELGYGPSPEEVMELADSLRDK